MKSITKTLLTLFFFLSNTTWSQNMDEIYINEWKKFYPSKSLSKGIHASIFQFEDFSKGDIGYDAVQFLVAKGVIRGFPDGTFRPMQDLTRAEAVKILLAEEGFAPFEIHPDEIPVFGDCVAWERGWVEEAVRQGIVKGYKDGTFQPSKPLTRAEAAKVIVEGR